MFTKSKGAFPLAATLCAASVLPTAFVVGSVSIAHAGQAGASGQRTHSYDARDYVGIYAQQQSGPYAAPSSSVLKQTPASRPFTWFEKRWFDYQDQE